MLARSAIRPLVAFVGVALAAGITTRAAVPVAQVLEVRSVSRRNAPGQIESSARCRMPRRNPIPHRALVCAMRAPTPR
jgi:hypothetical protein